MFHRRIAVCTFIATAAVGICATFMEAAPVNPQGAVKPDPVPHQLITEPYRVSDNLDVSTSRLKTDPVPHQLITEPYRVCDNLDELTSRINNLYRKPYGETIDPKTGVMQPESVYFKDTVTGTQIMCLTRELCHDIAHGDLGRPCWTCDGSHVLFMGDRGFIDAKGRLYKDNWPGHKYMMNADYSNQRVLMVRYDPRWQKPYTEHGNTFTSPVARTAGIDGKFNIVDPVDPKKAYYATGKYLWEVTLNDTGDSVAKLICTFSNAHPKIIQDISPDRKLLVQDSNVRPDDPVKTAYMPEFHLIDLKKKPGEPGFYYHHPMDYGLSTVKDAKGRVVHAADNNCWVHYVLFGEEPHTIQWAYGPMTSVGEPLVWTLNISHGLDGTPTHNSVVGGAGRNHFNQYESHGWKIGTSNYVLYYSAPPEDAEHHRLKGFPRFGGIYIRNVLNDNTLPRFITIPGASGWLGGHIAGGNSVNPDIWAAWVESNTPLTNDAQDSICCGHVTGDGRILCYCYTTVRGVFVRTGHKYTSWTNKLRAAPYAYDAEARPELSPDGTKVWYHSAMLEPTADWVGAYVAVIQHPQPPTDLTVSAGTDGHPMLSWKPAAMSHETKGYHVYRGDGQGAAFKELTHSAIPQSSFTDTSAKPGQTYTYVVTAEEWSTLESDTAASLLVKVTRQGASGSDAKPLQRWNKTPPPAVQGFTVRRDGSTPGQYRLSWNKDSAPGLRYYDVYFSTKGQPAISQKRLIDSPLEGMTQYLDWSAPTGTDAYYAITAVDHQGNESKPVYASVLK